MTLDDLQFPFHCVANTDHLLKLDTTFSYSVWLNDDGARAICNDIPCQICPFPCKEGKDRQQVLVDFARENFPEFLV